MGTFSHWLFTEILCMVCFVGNISGMYSVHYSSQLNPMNLNFCAQIYNRPQYFEVMLLDVC